MIRFKHFFTSIITWFSIGRVGITLLVLALPGIILWYAKNNDTFQIGDIFLQSYIEFAWELVSISFTILIIDRLYHQQDVRREKAQLIRQLRSQDIVLAQEASERLRAQGWLADGTLSGVNLHKAMLHQANWPTVNLQNSLLEGAVLQKANLREANFSKTKLAGVDFSFANLQGATITESQLQSAAKLAHAIMPDGTRYNGRFHLPGDLQDAQTAGFNTQDDIAMCRFYDIPQQAYKAQ